MKHAAAGRDHLGEVARRLRDVEAVLEGSRIDDQRVAAVQAFRHRLVQVEQQLAAARLHHIEHLEIVAEQRHEVRRLDDPAVLAQAVPARDLRGIRPEFERLDEFRAEQRAELLGAREDVRVAERQHALAFTAGALSRLQAEMHEAQRLGGQGHG